MTRKKLLYISVFCFISICLTLLTYPYGYQRFIDGSESNIRTSNITDDQEAVMLSILHNGIGPFLDNPKYASRIHIADKWELRESKIILATTVNLPNGKGVSLAFRDSGEITIIEYCYKKYAIARAIGTIFLFYMFCFAIVPLCIRQVIKFRHRRINYESSPSQHEAKDVKLISWRVVVIAFVGLFTGSICAATHALEWNRPIHYVDIVVTFALFPSLIVYLSLSEKCRKTLIYLIGVLVLTNMIAWEGMYMLLHGRFFDDVVYMSVIVFGVYAAIPLAVDYVKLKIVKAPDQSI